MAPIGARQSQAAVRQVWGHGNGGLGELHGAARVTAQPRLVALAAERFTVGEDVGPAGRFLREQELLEEAVGLGEVVARKLYPSALPQLFDRLVARHHDSGRHRDRLYGRRREARGGRLRFLGHSLGLLGCGFLVLGRDVRKTGLRAR